MWIMKKKKERCFPALTENGTRDVRATMSAPLKLEGKAEQCILSQQVTAAREKTTLINPLP